jgi:hypothetical protein
MACIATVEDTVSKIDQYQPINISESLRTKSYQLPVTSRRFWVVLEESGVVSA